MASWCSQGSRLHGYARGCGGTTLQGSAAQYACAGPARVEPCGPPMRYRESQSQSIPTEAGSASDQSSASHSLFAYPLESNFSGARYGLEPIRQLHQHGLEVCGGAREACCQGSQRWHVFLDAAKACGSRPPDLAAAPADFVVSSAQLPCRGSQARPEHICTVLMSQQKYLAHVRFDALR